MYDTTIYEMGSPSNTVEQSGCVSQQNDTDRRYKKLYHLVAPYRCKCCGHDMLVFTTPRQTVIDYKRIITQGNSRPELYALLTKYKVHKLKCLYCNKEWFIDWSHGWPMQLDQDKITSNFGSGS